MPNEVTAADLAPSNGMRAVEPVAVRALEMTTHAAERELKSLRVRLDRAVSGASRETQKSLQAQIGYVQGVRDLAVLMLTQRVSFPSTSTNEPTHG